MTATVAGSGSHAGLARDSRRRPAGTTVLFALLVVTVLVTGSIIFMSLWSVVPPHGDRMAKAMRTCLARESLLGRRPVTAADLGRLGDASVRLGRCLQPVYREQVSWAVYGTVLVFGLAALIYWVYPHWFIRRRRLSPISADDAPELAAYLEDLTRQAELDFRPSFLIAPYARTSSGLAFGRYGRRHVQLNAGLVTTFGRDRAKFGAVVMHELAHLRNRDVDITYLTMSIWWSFVAVALVPMVAVTLDPWLLRSPLRWRDPGIASPITLAVALLLLTGLGYLTRNAILRVREIHADARVAADAGARHGGALRDVVQALRPTARWSALTGTHPTRERRLRALTDPGDTLTPKSWPLFVAGMATAMIAVNLRYVVSLAVPTPAVTGFVATGMVCVPGLTGPLVVAIWRTTARLDSRLALRALVPMPVVLVGGFLLGEQLAWLSVYTQWTQLASAGVWQPLVEALLLLIGTLVIAAWAASVARSVLDSAGHTGRWTLPAVVTAATAASTPWFGVWNAFHDNGGLLQWLFGDELQPGQPSSPAWYASLLHWAELQYVPFVYLIYNALTLPALAVLWLVPLVAARRRTSPPPAGAHPYRIRYTVLAGLLGAVGVAPAGALLVHALKAQVPVEVRGTSGFKYSLYNSFIAVAVLAQAAVAAAVAGRARRHRPVLIPLSVLITGLLAETVIELGLYPLARCTGLYGTPARACLRWPEPGFAADTLHIILVKGTVAAMAAALVGACAGALLRRRRTPEDTEPHPAAQGRLSRTITAAVLTVLAAAIVLGAAAEAPGAYRIWIG
ncbi:M48 family metalloprotease [Actinoallomurus purpureus]|uniref:M48 family metalloprotease n=1 Tax=Actinoallomurus purpureus TaxID=478114 RepID=UPI00209212DA|nr:M48 family metalloprotease [Actinoallomurus purpureus]MCO6003550.1 M48 family metalloprotease [Actinoallomurus purpureus]